MKALDRTSWLSVATFRFVLLVAWNASLVSALAQGEIIPPGPPGPMFKTLSQVEPRTPISSQTNITQSGSYYLATNITVTAGDAITIAANGVTLDLNGFTISSTAPGGTGTGLLIYGNRRNITIRDGFIESGVTRSGGTFSGNGFANGIYFDQGSEHYNLLVSRVSVAGVRVEGIDIGTDESIIVQSCTVRIAGGNGIVAGVVRDCVVSECGMDAIIGGAVENCTATATGSGTGIKATSAINCRGFSFSGGKGVDAYNANNCRGIGFGFGSVGINAVSATGCTGSSDNGTGVFAQTALNCHGLSSGNSGFDGVNANTALNCYGESSGFGAGIFARFIAQNCYGENKRSTSGGYGVTASIGIGCFGISTSGTGLSAHIANSCSATSFLVTHRYNMP